MIESFDGKAAFVTGAASGICLALARALASKGAKVMLADIEEDALDAALRDLADSGANARSIACDVSNPISVMNAADEAFAAFGNVHVVCNNAGAGIGGLSRPSSRRTGTGSRPSTSWAPSMASRRSCHTSRRMAKAATS